MRHNALAIGLAALLVGAGVEAEVVDSVVLTGGTQAVVRINEDAGNFQNTNAFTLVMFFETDSAAGDTDRIFSIGQDQTSTIELAGMRVVATTGTMGLLDNSATTIDQSTAAATANTWYAVCYRSTGSAGAVELSWYAEDGTLIEDLNGTDANNGFTGATSLAIAFGARVNSTSYDTPLEGEVALMAVTLSDIGNAGCDTWAANPLNYSPPFGFTKLYDNNGDIVGTITDQSAASKNFTLNSTAAVSDEGGPTVTDFATDPVWDTPPSMQSQTAGAYTIAFDGGANAANIYCGAYLKDAATPTAAQIEAGTGAHGTATAAITGSSQTIVLTPSDSPVNPVYDDYCVAKSAGGLYTLVADGDLLDEVLDCPAGRNCQFPLASVDASSPFAGVGAVAGDYASIASITDPDAYGTDLDTDATVWYSAFGITSRQTIDAWNYDVSAAAQTDYLFVFNNLAPVINDPGVWPLTDTVYELGVDPTFASEDYVTDPEDDDITWAITAGAAPTDWTLNATTGVFSDGAPGACGDYTFTVRATDEFGSSSDFASFVPIHARVPNVAGDDESTATATLEAICTLTVAVSAETGCGPEAGLVIRTIPAVDEIVAGDSEVELVLSTGACVGGSGKGLRLRNRLKLRGLP